MDGPQRERRSIREWRERVVPGDPRAVGDEPDYRFTMANERTFLAWIRTALAFAAGGLGTVSFLSEFRYAEVLGIVLLVIAVATSAGAYRRWALNERAMRLNEPLPPSRLPTLMALATAIAAVVAVAVLAVGPW